MQKYPYVDCDYCCFENTGFQKPTRFFGSEHLRGLKSVLCDGKTCLGLEKIDPNAPKKHPRHRNRMGGNKGCAKKEVAYHIPPELIEYVSGLVRNKDGNSEKSNFQISSNSIEDQGVSQEKMDTELIEKIEKVRFMRLRAIPEIDFWDENPDEDEDVLVEIAQRMILAEKKIFSVKTAIEPIEISENVLVTQLKESLLAEFGDNSLSGKYPTDPLPIRGPFGEGEIWLKPEARPVSVPPYQLNGERREALDQLVGKAIEQGKLEAGKGPWNTPAFPVPKKNPGSYRLVQDLRPQNAATVKDGHLLP